MCTFQGVGIVKLGRSKQKDRKVQKPGDMHLARGGHQDQAGKKLEIQN